jgi:hypothetical protein
MYISIFYMLTLSFVKTVFFVASVKKTKNTSSTIPRQHKKSVLLETTFWHVELRDAHLTFLFKIF